MSAKREIKGFWWIPEKPETRWFGSLRLDSGHSASLEVFAEGGEPFKNLHPPARVIHGNDEHGRPVTLLFVMSPSSTFSGGMLRLTFHFSYLLLGVSVPDAGSFIAHELQVEVQYLYGWLGLSGFHRAEVQEPGEIAIRYRHPDEIKYQVAPNLELGLGIRSHAQNGLQEKLVNEEALITFRSSAGFSLSRCIELVTAVRHLLHLAVLDQVYPVQMKARKREGGQQIGDTGADDQIEIWGSVLRETTTEPPVGGEWTFCYADLSKDFATFFHDWLKWFFRNLLGFFHWLV